MEGDVNIDDLAEFILQFLKLAANCAAYVDCCGSGRRFAAAVLTAAAGGFECVASGMDGGAGGVTPHAPNASAAFLLPAASAICVILSSVIAGALDSFTQFFANIVKNSSVSFAPTAARALAGIEMSLI